MKKIITISLGFLLLSFSSKNNLHEIKNSTNIQREYQTSALIINRGTELQGSVVYDGDIVTRVSFKDIQAGATRIKIWIAEPTKARLLNKNNPIAVEYNFTHYVETNVGNAYFSL